MKRKRLFTKPEFNAIYRQVPRLCVDLLLFNNKSLFLIKRTETPNKGDWHCSGGTVFIHESLDDTIKRVAREEMDIKVDSYKMLGIMEFLKQGRNRHAVSIVYQIQTKDSPKNGKFFSRYGLPANMIPEQRAFFEQL